MRTRSLLVTALLIASAPTLAVAQLPAGCARPSSAAAPFAFVSVNGTCADLSAFITAQRKGWSLNTRANVGGSIIDIMAVFDPDPGLSFTGTTANPSLTATTYAFLFGTPIVPDFYTSAIASVQFSATSVSGTTTVANSATYPTYITGYGTVGSAFTNLGVNAGTTPCVASGHAASNDCAAESASSSFAPTFYDNLEALIAYTQDNTLSTATFNGSVTLDQVTLTPEPSTFALLGGALVLLAGCSRRRASGAVGLGMAEQRPDDGSRTQPL